MNISRITSRFLALMDLILILLGVFMINISNPSANDTPEPLDTNVIVAYGSQSTMDHTKIVITTQDNRILTAMNSTDFQNYVADRGLNANEITLIVLFPQEDTPPGQKERNKVRRRLKEELGVKDIQHKLIYTP